MTLLAFLLKKEVCGCAVNLIKHGIGMAKMKLIKFLYFVSLFSTQEKLILS